MASVRYIGSKLRVANRIMDSLPSDYETFYDLFSGMGTLSVLAAEDGHKVVCNDILKAATILTEVKLISYNDISFSKLGGYHNVITYLNHIDGYFGFMFNEYSPGGINKANIERRYFTPANAAKIDAVRDTIDIWLKAETISMTEKTLLLGDLLEATNRIANISGTYGGFLKKWTSASQKKITLVPRKLQVRPIDYQIFNRDIFEFPVPTEEKSIVYLDPPYTKRQYPAYYHILETISEWDRPNVSGITGLRYWKDKASPFSYKSQALNAITDIVGKFNKHEVFLSYSSDGHVDRDDLLVKLRELYEISIHELGQVGRYRPNKKAAKKSSNVSEFLINIHSSSL